VSVGAFAWLGARLRTRLPSEHLSHDSREIIKLGIGLIATLVALILGLLVATAKSSFDAKGAEIKQIAAKIVQMDRVLRQFGPEAAGVRRTLHALVAARVERPWMEETRAVDDAALASRLDEFVDSILALHPANERQQWLKSRALQLSNEALSLRWLFAQDVESTLSRPLLVVLVFWLAVIFASLGLFAPRNATVFVVLAFCALSVSTAVFVVLEFDRPFSGLIELSREPFRTALRQLDL